MLGKLVHIEKRSAQSRAWVNTAHHRSKASSDWEWRNPGIELNAKTGSIADLRAPHLWYPAAYAMKRKVILHVVRNFVASLSQGPTNSGKTFTAIKRLAEADSAVYCGPLRLLAAEIYDKLNTEHNVPCSLVTGQQIIEEPNARHTACTVEMADLKQPIEVAVIDEYQLISDSQRGWAWTRALLGLQAKEIHLTGDLSRIDLIRHIVELTGDELEVKYYERLLPLEAESGLSGSPAKVMPGDAVIAFSRRDVFALKRLIEMQTKHKCCVVYGNLPPEARKQQAELFNSAGSGYNVLVGTDAIGMGLNLNIRRVVFSAISKYDGVSRRLLTPAEVKQISGRAGRYKSIYPSGKVTALYNRDIKHIQKHLHAPLPKEHNRAAVIIPLYEQFEMLAEITPNRQFSDLVNFFMEHAVVDDNFSMGELESLQHKAKWIDDLELALEDRYIFCMAPLDGSDSTISRYFYNFARDFVNLNQVEFRKAVPNLHFASPQVRLSMLEEMYKVCDLYLWLANRFVAFVDAEHVTKLADSINDQISEILISLNQPKRNFPHRTHTQRPQPRPKKKRKDVQRHRSE